MPSLTGALGAAKAAYDMAVMLAKVNTTVEVNEKALELSQIIFSLQGAIATLQASNAELMQKLREAEERLRDIEDCKGDLSRYALCQPWRGTTVYALHQAMSNGEHPHYLCATCYTKTRKSILQITLEGGWVRVACHTCKTVTNAHGRGPVKPEYAELAHSE